MLLVFNTVLSMYEINDIYIYTPGACPGGGAQGAWAPPLEIEKQKKKKKKKKKVIRSNIKLFHLYFTTFLVENVIFSANF